MSGRELQAFSRACPLQRITGALMVLRSKRCVGTLGRGLLVAWRDVEEARSTGDFQGALNEPECILCAVRWYLRYSLSLRDVEELFA